MQRRDIHIHLGRELHGSDLHLHIQGEFAQSAAPHMALGSAQAAQFLGSDGNDQERGWGDQLAPSLPAEQRIAPRLYSLALAGEQTPVAERTVMSEALHALDQAAVTLERVPGTGLYSHRWHSVAPLNAVGEWILDVSRHFERLQCLITLKHQPFVWFAPDWQPKGPVILDPLSPRLMLDHLPRLQLTPTLSAQS